MATTFHQDKCTTQTTVTIRGHSAWPFASLGGATAHGYEIHMRRSTFGTSCVPFTIATDLSGNDAVVGVAEPTGHIAGTYCHGLFDSKEIVQGVINALRKAKRLAPIATELFDRRHALENDLNRLASVCRQSLDSCKYRRL